jgi:hypothetical protein
MAGMTSPVSVLRYLPPGREVLEYEEALEAATTPIVVQGNSPEGDPDSWDIYAWNEVKERTRALMRNPSLNDEWREQELRKEEAQVRLTAIQLRLSGVDAVPILKSLDSKSAGDPCVS